MQVSSQCCNRCCSRRPLSNPDSTPSKIVLEIRVQGGCIAIYSPCIRTFSSSIYLHKVCRHGSFLSEADRNLHSQLSQNRSYAPTDPCFSVIYRTWVSGSTLARAPVPWKSPYFYQNGVSLSSVARRKVVVTDTFKTGWTHWLLYAIPPVLFGPSTMG